MQIRSSLLTQDPFVRCCLKTAHAADGLPGRAGAFCRDRVFVRKNLFVKVYWLRIVSNLGCLLCYFLYLNARV